MRKRSLVAITALLLLHLGSIRADERAAAANAAKPWDALWRFETHG
jgi:hypothetical protein